MPTSVRERRSKKKTTKAKSREKVFENQFHCPCSKRGEKIRIRVSAARYRAANKTHRSFTWRVKTKHKAAPPNVPSNAGSVNKSISIAVLYMILCGHPNPAICGHSKPSMNGDHRLLARGPPLAQDGKRTAKASEPYREMIEPTAVARPKRDGYPVT